MIIYYSKSIGLIVVIIVGIFMALNGISLADNVQTYQHISVNENLDAFLKDFLRHFGVRAEVSEKVKRKISGQFVIEPNNEQYGKSGGIRTVSQKSHTKTTVQFPFERFEAIAREFGLVWYLFENTMYVYILDEIRSEMVMVEAITPADFITSLKRISIYDERFPIKYLNGQRFIYATGPPKYIHLIKEVAENIAAKYRTGGNPLETINVFKLEHQT